MAFQVVFNKLIKPPGDPDGLSLRWVRIRQENSVQGEEWTFLGSIFGAVVGYYTRLEGSLQPLLLRPELGAEAGFIFGSPTGSGRARLRREVEQVSATSGATLFFQNGQIYGRSGLSRDLVPDEALITDIFFREAAPDASRGPELYGDWQLGLMSIQPIEAFPQQAPPDGTTPIISEPVFTNGAQIIELWLQFSQGGGQVDPSDMRIRFEFQREGTLEWAPLMWEDNANALIGGGAATVPNYVYEIQDALGDLTLPADYPFTRLYIAPTRTWAGQIRAVIYNQGALADGAIMAGDFIVRGGGNV